MMSREKIPFYRAGSFKVFLVISTTFIVVQLIILLFPFFPTIEKETIENLKQIYGEKENLTGFGALVIKQIIQQTTFSSIVMLIIVFIYLLVDVLFYSKDKSATNENEESDNDLENSKRSDFAGVLTRLLISSLAASAIPAGISLILCALYDISLIKYMSGVEIYIAFAGISLISSMYFSIDEGQKHIKDNISDMEDFQLKE